MQIVWKVLSDNSSSNMKMLLNGHLHRAQSTKVYAPLVLNQVGAMKSAERKTNVTKVVHANETILHPADVYISQSSIWRLYRAVRQLLDLWKKPFTNKIYNIFEHNHLSELIQLVRRFCIICIPSKKYVCNNSSQYAFLSIPSSSTRFFAPILIFHIWKIC